MTIDNSIEEERTLVSVEDRLKMLPKYFGNSFYGASFDHRIFAMMGKLTSDYKGGFWKFYELKNGGFYMSLDSDSSYELADANGGTSSMSADAASIAACIMAYNHEGWRHYEAGNEKGASLLYELCEQLKAFASIHPERKQIYRIID